jgi:hypothetical protein
VKGSGLRGTTATRELKEGEAVALIPAELGVHLGSIYMNGPVGTFSCCVHAWAIIRQQRMHDALKLRRRMPRCCCQSW